MSKLSVLLDEVRRWHRLGILHEHKHIAKR